MHNNLVQNRHYSLLVSRDNWATVKNLSDSELTSILPHFSFPATEYCHLQLASDNYFF